jgi:hypothetical protein
MGIALLGMEIAGSSSADPGDATDRPMTASPIKHVIVIIGENQSFDHLYGTHLRPAEPSRLPLLAPLSFQPTRLGFDRDQAPVPTWIGAPNSRALSLDAHGAASVAPDTAPRSIHDR